MGIVSIVHVTGTRQYRARSARSEGIRMLYKEAKRVGILRRINIYFRGEICREWYYKPGIIGFRYTKPRPQVIVLGIGHLVWSKGSGFGKLSMWAHCGGSRVS